MGWMREMMKRFGVPMEDAEIAEEPAANGTGALEGGNPLGSAEGYQLAPDDGVRVDPMPITGRAEVTVFYSGLLAKAGADQVILHCGEGPGEWQNVRDIPMELNDAGEWTAKTEAGDGGSFAFCFRDALGNWDNNNGRDWSITVHTGDTGHH